MAHTYTEFFYHVVWATKMREPYLNAAVESAAYGYIRARCQDMGVVVYALDGMPDHAHLVCDIPPSLAVAEVLEKVKGASSYYVNHLPDEHAILYWQVGYGGLTFAKRNLSRVVAYVENQKRHHAAGATWPSLERLGDEVTR